jgi:hypothetical protein
MVEEQVPLGHHGEHVPAVGQSTRGERDPRRRPEGREPPPEEGVDPGQAQGGVDDDHVAGGDVDLPD